MRIAVIGAGAIGCVIGGLLALQRHKVTLIGRSEQVAALRAHGLHVDGALGSMNIPIQAATALDGTPDLLLLAVKTQDVAAAVETVRDRVDHVLLVTLQNGVRSDEIVAAAHLGAEVVSAVVVVTATYLEPGRVTLVERGHLVIGRPSGPPDGLVDRVRSVLAPAVLTFTSANMVGAHWLKLILNLNNAIPALTNESLRAVSADPFLRRLAVRLMAEGLRTVDAAGVALADLGTVSVRQIRSLTRLPTAVGARIFARQAGRLGGPWPVLGSTLQSLRRGRSTEIDFLNGEVVALGRKVHVATPLNERIVSLVHDLERTRTFRTPAALRSALADI